ncbi:MAG: Clp protease N-terminal domain-containing protein [Mycobacterium sp.]
MTERFSEDARAVCELALRQALQLGHNYIQPEHLLLALIQQEDSVTVRALAELDVEPRALRKMVLRVLSGDLQRDLHDTAKARVLVRKADTTFYGRLRSVLWKAAER